MNKKPHPTSKPRFNLGNLYITPGALEVLGHEEVLGAVARHVRGDWGVVPAEDAEANEHALVDGSRLLSHFVAANDAHFWIITEADRSSTTVLLPDEY